MDNKILVSFLTHRCQCPHVIKKGEELEAELHISTRENCLQSPMLKKDTSGATISSTPLALRWERAESSQVCSKFRLSPAMMRTSRLAARLFALRRSTYTNQMEKGLYPREAIGLLT